ncbi:hypothetical protein [Sulfitobacter sp. R18_1]|uniref:hypothetical protein n=1 Tax=Sulfitobacter sp. R18_1 TaxID=2821104 RepID=UPI001AD97758|nr:hypothetical protein [Sulfitobacter sp. R18_1]MBO9428196.1 hypothetical protein [Sulfitobacter sp. R18_1]
MALSRRVLMIIEKPSMVQYVVPHWLDQFPHDHIHLFCTLRRAALRFKLNRNLPLSAAPLITEPVLERIPSEECYYCNGDFGEEARAADHIICANGFAPHHSRNLLDLMTEHGIETPLSEVSWVPIEGIDAEEIKSKIKLGLRADHPDFTRMASIGHARRYFNYLYLVNALPVFGLALRSAGIDTTGNLGFISKYTLQSLLLLDRADPGPLLWNDIVKLMRNNPASKTPSPIGTVYSREALITWLWDSGCLTSDNGKRTGLLSLSDRGRRLASLFHKDCFDPHLSSRFEGWGENWPASKPAIDRYIRSFFGKEKRFLLKRS